MVNLGAAAASAASPIEQNPRAGTARGPIGQPAKTGHDAFTTLLDQCASADATDGDADANGAGALTATAMRHRAEHARAGARKQKATDSDVDGKEAAALTIVPQLFPAVTTVAPVVAPIEAARDKANGGDAQADATSLAKVIESNTALTSAAITPDVSATVPTATASSDETADQPLAARRGSRTAAAAVDPTAVNPRVEHQMKTALASAKQAVAGDVPAGTPATTSASSSGSAARAAEPDGQVPQLGKQSPGGVTSRNDDSKTAPASAAPQVNTSVAPHAPVTPVADVESNSIDTRTAARRESVDASVTAPKAVNRSTNVTPGATAAVQSFAAHVVSATTSAAEATAAEASLATGDARAMPDDLPKQIIQAMRLQWADGTGTAKVTLQPDYLGDLRVSIRVEDGGVTATLHASTADVRQWIEGHESMLRQALADQGLRLERLTVADEAPPASRDDQPGERQRERNDEQPSRRRTPQDQETTFEVVV